MLSTRKITILCLAILLAMFAAGCKKKVAAPPPPPPPAAAPAPPPAPRAPVISQFAAEPGTIQRGESATLRWQVTGDATSISINQGVGSVQATGNSRVQPANSTTYTLTASGPGGSVTSTATVNVQAPPPPPPPAPVQQPARPSIEQRLASDVHDVYYDYDKSDVSAEARDILTKNAAALKSIIADFPGAVIIVEGHCDERGSAEYNLGLGDRRSGAAKEFLVGLGMANDKLKSISYGKEKPQCSEATEACYQKNRRAHFTAQ